MREQKKTDPYPPCPPPCCNYSRISGPPEQYNLSPLLPHIGRRYLPYSSPTQYMCLIQLANDLQDPYLTPCTLAIKMDQGPRTMLALPPSICVSSNQQMTHKTPSRSLYPGYKNGPRTGPLSMLALPDYQEARPLC